MPPAARDSLKRKPSADPLEPGKAPAKGKQRAVSRSVSQATTKSPPLQPTHPTHVIRHKGSGNQLEAPFKLTDPVSHLSTAIRKER